jgi:hypothetical protein
MFPAKPSVHPRVEGKHSQCITAKETAQRPCDYVINQPVM